MHSLAFITLMVTEKKQMLSFPTSSDTWPTKTCKLSPLNTHHSHTISIMHDLLIGCSNHFIFQLQHTKILTRISKASFVVQSSDITVTLKQSQAHQNYNENVHTGQGYKHTNIHRSRDNTAQDKDKVRVVLLLLLLLLFSREYMSVISL